MTHETHIYNRFTGYTLEDCACEYCLHYDSKKKGCQLEKCCCEEERQAAFAREQAKNPAIS